MTYFHNLRQVKFGGGYSTCSYTGNMTTYVFNYLSGGGRFLGVKLFQILEELMGNTLMTYEKDEWRQEMRGKPKSQSERRITTHKKHFGKV